MLREANSSLMPLVEFREQIQNPGTAGPNGLSMTEEGHWVSVVNYAVAAEVELVLDQSITTSVDQNDQVC